MAKNAKWITNSDDEFEEDDYSSAASLTDLPVTAVNAAGSDLPASAASEEFEFRPSSAGCSLEASTKSDFMCAADEVFFKGQLLPLHPSFPAGGDTTPLLHSSSSTGSSSSSGLSSRSDSRSASSNSSGSRSCLSKSASSGSGSGGETVPARRSVSNNYFYTFPSPTPQLKGPRRSNASASSGSARRSTGSAPPSSWGLIRLGVVGAPDVFPPPGSGGEIKSTARATGGKGIYSNNGGYGKLGEAPKKKKKRGGFACSCSLDAIEPVTTSTTGMKKKSTKKKDGGVKRAESFCSKRIFEWLEDLSIAKEKTVA